MHRRADRLLPYVTALALVGLNATSFAEQASPVATAPGTTTPVAPTTDKPTSPVAASAAMPATYRIGIDANLAFGTMVEGVVSARYEERLARHHAITYRLLYGTTSWWETEADDPMYTQLGARLGYRAYLEHAYLAVEVGANVYRATYPVEERTSPERMDPPWFGELEVRLGVGWKLGPVDLGFEWSKAVEGFGAHLGFDFARW